MMRRLLLLALFACPHVHAQLMVRDDLGRPVMIRKHATRIVTLSPLMTEAVFAVGAGNLVVGVDNLSNDPLEATRLPKIATGSAFTLDAIAALKPDLVLARRDGIRRDDVERISGFGAMVYVAEARRLDDVPRVLTAVGAFTGRDTGPVAKRYEEEIARVKRLNAGKPRMTVFLEIWNRPLTTVSGTAFLTEAAEVCHGDSVFAELAGIAPLVEIEEVRAANPYVIVGVGSASNAEEFRSNWYKHRDMRAVKEGRLVFLDNDALQRASLRSPDAIAQLCTLLDEVRVRSGMLAANDAMQYTGPGTTGTDPVRMPATALERDLIAALSMRFAPGQAATGPAAPAAAPPPREPARAAPTPAAPASAAAVDRANTAATLGGEPLQLSIDSGMRTAAPPAASAPTLAVAPPAAPSPPPSPSPATGAASARAAPALSNYTQVRRYGDLYFVSGQIALDPASGRFDGAAQVEAQTRAAMENVRRVLEDEHLTLANVVSATVYLRDINDLVVMDSAYESFFRSQVPARTVVEATNLPRGARVEVAVIAGR